MQVVSMSALSSSHLAEKGLDVTFSNPLWDVTLSCWLGRCFSHNRSSLTFSRLKLQPSHRDGTSQRGVSEERLYLSCSVSWDKCLSGGCRSMRLVGCSTALPVCLYNVQNTRHSDLRDPIGRLEMLSSHLLTNSYLYFVERKNCIMFREAVFLILTVQFVRKGCVTLLANQHHQQFNIKQEYDQSVHLFQGSMMSPSSPVRTGESGWDATGCFPQCESTATFLTPESKKASGRPSN